MPFYLTAGGGYFPSPAVFFPYPLPFTHQLPDCLSIIFALLKSNTRPSRGEKTPFYLQEHALLAH